MLSSRNQYSFRLQAFELGSVEAKHGLANFYRDGIYVEPDIDQAVGYYRQCAEEEGLAVTTVLFPAKVKQMFESEIPRIQRIISFCFIDKTTPDRRIIHLSRFDELKS